MTRNAMAVASALVVAAMVVTGVAVATGLPDGMPLPTHWNLAGEADGFSDKWTALLMPAGITAALSLLSYFLPLLEPRGKSLERSQGLYLASWIAVLLVGVVIEFIVVAVALGWPVPVGAVLVGAMGATLVLIGNQLGKSRSMYFIGIRTPWTLASEEVWIKTHRLGGKLAVGGGAAMVVAAMLPIRWGLLGAVALAVIVVTAAVPVLYSLLLWRREQASGRAKG
jgi:uncharacterized membrane protein